MSTLYDFCVPVYTHALDVLEHILQKGEAYCKEQGISEEEILAFRMAPDMLPFTNQIQILCNGAKNCLTRVAGAELDPVPDDEKTLADLHARIAHTKTLFNGITKEQFEGKENIEVTFGSRAGQERKFSGLTYVRNWAVPNLYFHLTTVYIMFRSKGAPVGKMDFIKGSST